MTRLVVVFSMSFFILSQQIECFNVQKTLLVSSLTSHGMGNTKLFGNLASSIDEKQIKQDSISVSNDNTHSTHNVHNTHDGNSIFKSGVEEDLSVFDPEVYGIIGDEWDRQYKGKMYVDTNRYLYIFIGGHTYIH